MNDVARTEGVEAAADVVREHARPLNDSADLDPLVEQLGDAQYVLLGEASHGTAEFYRWRARLTARLISEEGFSFVGVEGDWTDCYEINRYVKGKSEENSARAVLDEFDRWPTWMWANWEVLEFVEWLADYNRGADEGVGFYGLDVYSLFESMDEVLSYLERIDPDAVADARQAYGCFEPYAADAQEYARATRLAPESCEDEVVELLTELRERAPAYTEEDEDAYFNAEQNALVAKNAEQYYRTMVQSSSESWNVRDRHMVQTLERLHDHYGADSKAVVWAHNTHVGDARATTMEERGRLNIGQVVRENNADDDVALVGFGTHRGEVIAGSAWGAGMERMSVPPGKDGSHEDAFHRAGADDKLLLFDEADGADALAERRGHRAIGVVYDPAREAGNYVPTVLPERYDAFLYVDETSALHPLHMEPHGAEEPETYPWGL